jgi:hypothetical protein
MAQILHDLPQGMARIYRLAPSLADSGKKDRESAFALNLGDFMQAESSSTQFRGVDRRGLSEDKLRHVNDHLTPLAAIIVLPALLVADLPVSSAIVVGSLIVLSVILNYSLMYLARGNKARFFGSIRVVVNYVVNILLLWLLYATWSPVWLLLLLMSIGVAVYQNRRDSFLAGLAFAVMLLVVHWNFGELSMMAWTQVGVEASMVILVNLYVNGLLRGSHEK